MKKKKRSVPTVPIDTYVLDFIRPSQKEVCQFAANLLPIYCQLAHFPTYVKQELPIISSYETS